MPALCPDRNEGWPPDARCILLAGHQPNLTPSGPHVPNVGGATPRQVRPRPPVVHLENGEYPE